MVDGNSIPIVVGIEPPGELELTELIEAGDTHGRGLCLGKGGKEKTGKNGDYGDHHKKFDQGESAGPALKLNSHDKIN